MKTFLSFHGISGAWCRFTHLREVEHFGVFTASIQGFQATPFNVDVAPLSRRSLDWLPAIEVRGEGIYIELNEELLVAWEQPAAIARAEKIAAEVCRQLCERNGWDFRLVTAREILVHTLSHLLMKQLSECRYSR